MSRTNPWIIVGGGASGLASAFFLRELGIDSIIVERDGVVGGRMGTVRLGNRTLDCGGKNIGRRYTLFRRFAASLGEHPLEHFGLNSSQAVNGRLRTFDGGARWRTMAGLAQGTSISDVARFGQLLWNVRSDEATGYLGSEYGRSLADRYDAQPASRYFSDAFCRRILRPMTVRMNGAEPDEVYVGNLTSNVRMVLDTYDQFANGLAPLLDAFVDRYDVRLHAAAELLLVENGRVTGVRVRYADGSVHELRGAGVILATPANTAAALTTPWLPELGEQLRRVAYYPVTLIIAEYDRPVFPANVRAVVFDEDEALSNAGAYGMSDLNVVRYTFSGRQFRRGAPDVHASDLLDRAEAALGRHICFDRSSRRRFVTRRFSTGLCAYTPHHGRFIDRIAHALRGVAGLHLTGDYVQGASIEACFRSASACVRQIARHEQPAAPASDGWDRSLFLQY